MGFADVTEVLGYVNMLLDMLGMKPLLGATVILFLGIGLVRWLFDR